MNELCFTQRSVVVQESNDTYVCVDNKTYIFVLKANCMAVHSRRTYINSEKVRNTPRENMAYGIGRGCTHIECISNSDLTSRDYRSFFSGMNFLYKPWQKVR